MGNLRQQTIEHLATYMTDIQPAYKSQIYFSFSNKEAGAEAYDLLKEDYSAECNYDAWSGWFGIGDKRDFYLGFTDAATRSEVFSEIKQAVANYNTSTSSGLVAKAKSWGAYLAVGVAVVLIIIMLWKKFRK